jgi:uncharacterized membrane protein YesL
MNITRNLLDDLKEVYYNIAQLAILNVEWLVLTLLIVTAPPAAAGLFYTTNLMAKGYSVTWTTFFEGFRKYFWLSWKWGLTVLFGFVILGGNLYFYGLFEQTWANIVWGLFMGLILLWAILNSYTFPLLLEQTDVRIRTALRNSLVLVRYPLYNLTLFSLLIILAIISTLTQVPWMLLTFAVSAFLITRTILRILETITGTKRILRPGDEGLQR